MICTNCQSQYGQTVNVRDGGKAEWQCRDCKAVQPWVDEVRTGGLRPAKLADLAKRPAWIEAAAEEIEEEFDLPVGCPVAFGSQDHRKPLARCPVKIPRELERRILATPGVVVRRHGAHRQRKPHAVPCLTSVSGVVSLRIRLPLKLPSLPNKRLHWKALYKLKREQKETVAEYLKDAIVPPLPVTVTMTRFGPRRLDSDNLAGAFKACRDAIADAYGVDDGDEMFVWVPRQKLGKEYAVEIEIEAITGHRTGL